MPRRGMGSSLPFIGAYEGSSDAMLLSMQFIESNRAMGIIGNGLANGADLVVIRGIAK